MSARESSEHARKTVKIRGDVAHLGGQEYTVEDWWINVFGKSWMVANGNFAAMNYAVRSAAAGLPTDDEVLYGKVDGLGHLVHVSEIEASEGGAS